MVWTLRKKIFSGYSVILILLIFILIWMIIRLLRLGEASDRILRDNYKSILAAQNMIGAIERQDSGSLLVILGYEAEGLQQFNEYMSAFLQWFNSAKENITVEGEAQIIEEIDTAYSSYLNRFMFLGHSRSLDEEEASRYYHESLLPAFTSIRKTCEKLREINQAAMFLASEKAKIISSKAILSVSIAGIICLCIGLVFSILLSNLLVRPLRQMVDATKKVSEGVYEAKIQIISSDELGSLAVGFNEMVTKLKRYRDMNISQLLAEKRKSEAIIRNIDDGLIVMDADFKIMDANPVALDIIGDSRESIIGRHFLEVFKDDSLFQYLKQALKPMRKKADEEGKNIFTLTKGEKHRHYHFSVTSVTSHIDEKIGIVLLLRDVTRFKELERLKSEFVMAASHELKTPLTGIKMSIGLLKESTIKKLNPREKGLLTAASEETQRLESLVKELLDLSRIEAGKMEMEFRSADVPALFEKVRAVMRNQASAKKVTLTQETKRNLPQVTADADKILLVLTNLISNALGYTHKGGHIRLSSRAAGGHVFISVADDGEGIPYESQTKIFDKFVQFKDNRHTGGSGLGLSICKQIIRAHGGAIWVDSTPGSGSTFTFTLPAAGREA